MVQTYLLLICPLLPPRRRHERALRSDAARRSMRVPVLALRVSASVGSVVLAYELDIAHSREKVVMRGPYGAYGPRAASLIVGSSVGFVRCTT